MQEWLGAGLITVAKVIMRWINIAHGNVYAHAAMSIGYAVGSAIYLSLNPERN